MIDYIPFYTRVKNTSLAEWLSSLPQQVEEKIYHSGNGNLKQWIDALFHLPDIEASDVDLRSPIIRVGRSEDANEKQRKILEETLRVFMPWRKGPFDVCGLRIDAEWRSDLKWDRFIPHIRSLEGKKVLDVGCGNGYYGWRMRGEGASVVVGIDPTLLYVFQFHAIQKYVRDDSFAVLPLALHDMPEEQITFDTIFSMGVLYHQRSPFDHFLHLKKLLAPAGELILETLIIDGKEGTVLVPEDRYAKMRNVWFIASVPTINAWLKKVGFDDIQCVDETVTTPTEQRATGWLNSDPYIESLKDFLDPQDTSRTIEGYPAPKRAIFIARNKEM